MQGNPRLMDTRVWGFRVKCLGVQGLGVQGLGVQGLGFRVWGNPRLMDTGLGALGSPMHANAAARHRAP